MANDSVRPLSIPSQAAAELELIELILNESATPYPWNPADPDVWSHCDALEREIADTWSAEEFEPYVQSLASQIDQLWDTVPSPSIADAFFPTALFQQLSAQIPSNMLEGIMQRARHIIAENLSLADQMVLCVRDLLPNWADDDLYVMARPFAHAMRSGIDSQQLENNLQSLRCASWEELSEIEQARLSLAIARCVLSERSTPNA